MGKQEMQYKKELEKVRGEAVQDVQIEFGEIIRLKDEIIFEQAGKIEELQGLVEKMIEKVREDREKFQSAQLQIRYEFKKRIELVEETKEEQMKIELNKQITKMKEVLNQELEFRLKQSKDRAEKLETQLVEAYESRTKEIKDSVELLANQ